MSAFRKCERVWLSVRAKTANYIKLFIVIKHIRLLLYIEKIIKIMYVFIILTCRFYFVPIPDKFNEWFVNLWIDLLKFSYLKNYWNRLVFISKIYRKIAKILMYRIYIHLVFKSRTKVIYKRSQIVIRIGKWHAKFSAENTQSSKWVFRFSNWRLCICNFLWNSARFQMNFKCFRYCIIL